MSLPQTGCFVWCINETPTLSAASANINFVANATEYSSITITSSEISYGSTSVYSSSAWGDDGNRVIIFATEPIGALLTWLNANATEFGYSGEAWWWNDNPDLSSGEYYSDVGSFETVIDGEYKSWGDTTDIRLKSTYIQYYTSFLSNKGVYLPISGTDKLIVFNEAVTGDLLTFLQANATKLASGTTRRYTVTFNANGHGTNPESQSVVYKQRIDAPTYPTATGYTCVGWYKEASCTNIWNFTVDKVTANTMLYAKWSTITSLDDTSWVFNNVLDFSPAQLGYLTEDLAIGGWDVNFETASASWTQFFIQYATPEGASSPLYIFGYSYDDAVYLSDDYEGYTAGWLLSEYKTIHITSVSLSSESADAELGALIDFIETNATTPSPYTVTFNVQGHGTAPESQSVIFGRHATAPTTPTATGYTFSGWYKESSCTNAWDFSTNTVTDDTTLYASWTLTVSFDLQGYGTAIASQQVREGATAIEPSNPIQAGYTFGGWYNEAACTTAFDFSTVINSDKTLYAKWTVTTYTITYNLDGGSVSPANPSTYTIETSSFTLTNPTQSLCDFLGWTGTGLSEATQTVTIPQGSTGNRTYTATWTLTSYDVEFNMQGHGEQVETQSVVSGQTATEPTAPTETGWVFGGWYTEAACTNAFNFATAITENKTLYAKWTVATNVVTFDVQGHGTAPSSQTIDYGSTATKPTNPTASGWVFGGWYEEASCTNEFNFSTPIIAAKTLYAKWVDTSTTFTVSFNTQGHGTVESQQVVAGEYAIAPTDPSATGLRFTGWHTTAQCITLFAFATTPITGNTTLYAGWELGRVADPQRGQSSTITSYRDYFDDNDITSAQNLVSSTNLPLKASILNGPTNIVGTSSTNPGLQGMHKTLVTDVLENDKETWFNEDSGNEGWVYNLIHTARAAFDATKTYRKNDIVTYNNDGKTYIAKQDVETGTLPTNTTNWLALSIQGEQGNPWWGVNYKGNWDSTVAYNAKDMVRHMEGDDLSTAVFYVAMTNQSAGSPLTNWLKALEMKESKIQETASITGLTGTYYIDDGSGNITFYDAQGSTADTLYTYTVMSNVLMTSSTTSYVSSDMYMNNALIALSSRNNLY